jgi:hypothetical protein
MYIKALPDYIWKILLYIQPTKQPDMTHNMEHIDNKNAINTQESPST